MPTYAVQTLTAGFVSQVWPAITLEEAEKLARKLSLAAIADVLHPNPFCVLETDGTVHCKYLAGVRLAADEMDDNLYPCV